MRSETIHRKLFSLKTELTIEMEKSVKKMQKQIDRVSVAIQNQEIESKAAKENERLRYTIGRLELKLLDLTNKLNNRSDSVKMYSHTRSELVRALEKNDGVRELTAEELGISINTLYGAVRRMGIQIPSKRRKKTVNGIVTWPTKK